MKEMDSALKKIKAKKAGGTDGIGTDYIRHLPTNAKTQLLQIFNYSWEKNWVPQSWRKAVIVPIHKKGKPADKVQSYRPIALTSNLGKLMERMVAARLV